MCEEDTSEENFSSITKAHWLKLIVHIIWDMFYQNYRELTGSASSQDSESPSFFCFATKFRTVESLKFVLTSLFSFRSRLVELKEVVLTKIPFISAKLQQCDGTTVGWPTDGLFSLSREQYCIYIVRFLFLR